MASPVLTKALTRLRTDFNTIAPSRDKASDGWIGDEAHQQNTSGHNPDDTPGSKAEYSDSDSIPEVRAIDVDKDLRQTGLTMQQCINKILASSNDLRRLKYIIFNRVIWSKSDGWRPREYTGSNTHEQHGHFSGDPNADESNEGWSILELGEDVALTDDDVRRIWSYKWESPGLGQPPTTAMDWVKNALSAYRESQAVRTDLAALSTAVAGGAQVIIDGVIAGLPEGVALTKDDVKQCLTEWFANAAQANTVE